MKRALNRLLPLGHIESHIYFLRGEKVMLGPHLASLYGVETKILNQSVKRNIDRFPSDFMFKITQSEFSNLRSQFVTSSWGGHRWALYAFTEQGVVMLSSVLNSPRAVHVNIEIMRAFVKLRKFLQTHADLARKLAELENKYDHQFKVVFDAIRELMSPAPPPSKGRLGFQPPGARGARGKRRR